LSRRVEVAFPIEQPDLKRRLIDEVLMIVQKDNVKAHELLPDGTWKRVKPADGEAPLRSQARFLELAVLNANRRQAPPATPPPASVNGEARPVRRQRRRASNRPTTS